MSECCMLQCSDGAWVQMLPRFEDIDETMGVFPSFIAYFLQVE